MFVLKNEGRRKKKKKFEKFFFLLMGWHAVPPQARPVPTFWKNSGIFYFFLDMVGLVFGQWLQKNFASYLDKYLQNNTKQTK